MLEGGYAVGTPSDWFEAPVMKLLKLIGEKCDCAVTWRLENISIATSDFNTLQGYVYTFGDNNEYLAINTAERFVVGANQSSITYDHIHIDPGVVEFYATCDGTEYGPATLTFVEI